MENPVNKQLIELAETIKQLSEKEPKTMTEMALKLAEETGEVAQSILSVNQVSGNGYKELTIPDAMEECVDVLLVATALFYKLSAMTDNAADKEQLIELLEKKAAKWSAKMVEA